MVKTVCSYTYLLLACILQCACSEVTAQAVFEYRGIYSPTNADDGFRSQYGTNHVDFDWDLWGHGMKKIAANAPESVYATVSGEVHREQFCFSSEKLYELTTAYILDQFGEGNAAYSARICIMPQDNKVACTCSKCIRAGNTPGNATPAVTAMLTRLAKRFPRHRFYTSAYHTTLQLPARKLPANVGVLVSAARFQHRVNLSQAKGYEEMRHLLADWKKITPNVYVWDYARNFNDYLSPFPCLHAMQSRFRFYREMGVKGILINGSGYDYSSFDDVQSVVMAQLMADPDLDVDKAIEAYFKEHYPVTSDLLTEYYTALESRTVETNHHLPIYGESMQELTDSYLKPEEFKVWRARLDKASKQTEGQERKQLNYLLTALSYTQLRLLEGKDSPEAAELRGEMVAVLQGSLELKEMKFYSEDGGSIADYLKKFAR